MATRYLLRIELTGHNKFVSAEAPDYVGLAEGCRQKLRSFDQGNRAGAVSQLVVDDLQIIHVDEEDSEGNSGAASKSKCLFGKQIEPSEVVKPGQFIAQSQVVNLVLHAVDEARQK